MAMFRVASVDAVCDGVKTFRLVRFDRKPVLPFEAGAHVLLTVKDAASGVQGTRAYTLTSSPQDAQGYEITVARGDRADGISALLHTAVGAGRVVTVSDPVHGFGLADGAPHHVLIAGGIGITPIVSLARQLEQAATPFSLFYSAKSQAGMPFLDEIRALRHAACTTATTVAPATGRLDVRRILEQAPAGTHVYVCGPAGMMQDTLIAAKDLCWDDARVHVESFQGAASPDDAAFDVVLARTGRQIAVPPGQSILDVLLAAGIAVDYDCRHGACGRCTQRVLQGEPDQWIRICVSRAKSPTLVLDL